MATRAGNEALCTQVARTDELISSADHDRHYCILISVRSSAGIGQELTVNARIKPSREAASA